MSLEQNCRGEVRFAQLSVQILFVNGPHVNPLAPDALAKPLLPIAPMFTFGPGLTDRTRVGEGRHVDLAAPQQDRVALGEAEDVNILGRASALTSINTIRPYGVPVLRALFFVGTHVPALTAKLRLLSFIHFARWTIVDALPGERLERAHLLFESNFNGTWSQYIDAFSYVVPTELGAIWRWCYGFPGPIPAGPFKADIARHEFPAAHYYAAYPEASTTMVAGALEVRKKLDRLRRRARAMDAAEFDEAWREFLIDTQPHL
jgi:hypothetical protein